MHAWCRPPVGKSLEGPPFLRKPIRKKEKRGDATPCGGDWGDEPQLLSPIDMLCSNIGRYKVEVVMPLRQQLRAMT